MRNKWWRNDALTFVEKYTGIRRKELYRDIVDNSYTKRCEVIKSLAPVVMEMVEDIERGIYPESMEPVRVRRRPDGMTGKIRDIAMLCIPHQLLGHVTKVMIEPLLAARIEVTQHASIPGRGQTKLKDQTHKLLRCHPEIGYVVKTDVKSAYKSLSYTKCIEIIKKEIPSARTAIAMLDYLGSIAPGGHLIIGGYIDAWLFNLVMSYAIRYLYTIGKRRRGKFIPAVKKCIAYMDDLAIYGSSAKDLKRATKDLQAWMKSELDLDIKVATGIYKIMPIEEERARKAAHNNRAPAVDMAGYRICRSYVTIRRRVFKRLRRQYIRAWREYETDGRLRLFRARKIICYYSYIKRTDGHKIAEKYHAEELMDAATKEVGSYERYAHRERIRRLNNVIYSRGSG